MSKKPIIGITGIFMGKEGPRGHYGIGGDYIKSVRMAGGCPVILSETNDPELIAQYGRFHRRLPLPRRQRMLLRTCMARILFEE